ncbi:MAG: hypothetical protein Q4B85_10590 [Lachnospiraceae bacterium]|nr:hypothetical protein [Lachnospiraceae bacterium]
MTKKTLRNAKKVTLAITCAATFMTAAAPLVHALETDPSAGTTCAIENVEEAEAAILDELQEERTAIEETAIEDTADDETANAEMDDGKAADADAAEEVSEETEVDTESGNDQKVIYPDWWYESADEEDNEKVKSKSCKADMETYEAEIINNIMLFPSLSDDGNRILYKDNHGVVMAFRDRSNSREEVDQYQVQVGEVYHFRTVETHIFAPDTIIDKKIKVISVFEDTAWYRPGSIRTVHGVDPETGVEMDLTIGGRGEYKVYPAARYGNLQMVEGAEHVVMQKRPTTKSEIIKKRNADPEYRNFLNDYIYCIYQVPKERSAREAEVYRMYIKIELDSTRYPFEYFESIDENELPEYSTGD